VISVEGFLEELDSKWKPLGGEPTLLHIFGSTALMLQADFTRPTKDTDVLETAAVNEEVKTQLLKIAGKKSPMHEVHRMFLEVVAPGILFLPGRGNYVPIPKLDRLKNFRFEAMSIVDVVVSKLKRFKASDQDDIRAMVEAGKVDHAEFVARFKGAVDQFGMDARSDKLPECIENFQQVETEMFRVEPTEVELPPWFGA